MRRIIAIAVLPVLLGAAGPVAEPQLAQALDTIRTAALSRDAAQVAPLIADAATLVSQSGKVYDKSAILADIGGGFEAWDNSDVVVRDQGDLAVVTLVNSRKRPQTDPARFRVMQVWKRQGKGWALLAQSSVRLPPAP